MNPVSWVRSVAPDWAVVMAVAGTVGAVSAILSVAVYRDLVVGEESAIPVESEAGA